MNDERSGEAQRSELQENVAPIAQNPGIVHKLAGGIAFLVSMVALATVMVLIAAIEPLSAILYSKDNMQTTIQVAIVVGIAAMWSLRAWLRKPK